MIFMAAVALWFFTAGFSLLDKLQPGASNALGRVSADHEVVQTFTAVSDNLSRVELVINKTDPHSQGSLRLQVLEFEGTQADGAPILGEALRESRLDTGSFDYLGGHRFQFDPLTVSPGAVYALRVTSDSTETAEVWLMGSGSDPYKGGSLFKDGIPANGDLYFALYQSTDAGGLLDKNIPFRPAPLNSAILFGILFILGAGSFGWLLAEIAGVNKRNKT